MKNFDSISNKLIADRNLLRLDICILAPSYLEEKRACFIKIMENNNKESDQNAKKKPIVSNSKKKL